MLKSWKDRPIAFIDTETTGFGRQDRIVEMSVLIYENRRFASQYTSIFNPGNNIDWESPFVIEAMKVNGLDRRLLESSFSFKDLWPSFLVQIDRGGVYCGQHFEFDLRMLDQECERAGIEWKRSHGYLDTEILDWALHPGQESYKLGAIAARWDVPVLDQHRASSDAEICAKVLVAMMDQLPDGIIDMSFRANEWRRGFAAWRERQALEKNRGRS